jgi:hypothetical protein
VLVVKQLMKPIKKMEENQTKIRVLRLELDYELAVLYEALQNKHDDKVKESKEKLNKIRNELILYQAL